MGHLDLLIVGGGPPSMLEGVVEEVDDAGFPLLGVRLQRVRVAGARRDPSSTVPGDALPDRTAGSGLVGHVTGGDQQDRVAPCGTYGIAQRMGGLALVSRSA